MTGTITLASGLALLCGVMAPPLQQRVVLRDLVLISGVGLTSLGLLLLEI